MVPSVPSPRFSLVDRVRCMSRHSQICLLCPTSAVAHGSLGGKFHIMRPLLTTNPTSCQVGFPGGISRWGFQVGFLMWFLSELPLLRLFVDVCRVWPRLAEARHLENRLRGLTEEPTRPLCGVEWPWRHDSVPQETSSSRSVVTASGRSPFPARRCFSCGMPWDAFRSTKAAMHRKLRRCPKRSSAATLHCAVFALKMIFVDSKNSY